jgi:hypothetical protein
VQRIVSPFLAVVLASGAAGCQARPVTPEGQAKAFFERYRDLETRYDPAIADLYADSAIVRKFMLRSSGDTLYGFVTTGAMFKSSFRDDAAAAKGRGARNRYSDVSYTRDGNHVRVTMRRYQEPPGVELGQIWWVGPGAEGEWRIWKELAQVPGSRP